MPTKVSPVETAVIADAVPYNAIGDHTGTSGLTTKAIIAHGFRQYAYLDALRRTLTGMLHAARHFDHERQPEVFAGTSAEIWQCQLHYPVACHPQGLGSGRHCPFMLESALGCPRMGSNASHLSSVLPDTITTLSIDLLTVGDASLRIAIGRTTHGELTWHMSL